MTRPIARFAPDRRAVGELFRAVLSDRDAALAEAFSQWRNGLCDVDFEGHRVRQGLASLARACRLRVDPAVAAELLFAAQGHYAVAVASRVEHVRARRAAASDPADRAPGECLFHVAERAPGANSPMAAWRRALACDAMHRLCLEPVPTADGPVPRETARRLRADDVDPFRGFYETLFPRNLRHGLGEYYTPAWLARLVLDEAEYDGDPRKRLLDPTCGSGVFLSLAVRRCVARKADPPDVDDVCRRIVGFDIHPLAVLTARANYFLALESEVAADLAGRPPPELPVFLRDAVLDASPAPPAFDCVVGNPPWIAWDHLPGAYREATKPLWQRYGLFSLSGAEARHGGGKKDLAMLVVYVAADRYLKSGGRLAMVLPQTVLQTKGAGDGFRRFRLGEGEPLAVRRVHDLVEVRPFAPASNWTATILLEKGAATEYPVPYVRWTATGRGDRRAVAGGNETAGGKETPCNSGSGEADPPGVVRESCLARPIDPARPTSPWAVWPAALADAMVAMAGRADYVAHLGANTGGANGVFWLDVVACDGTQAVVRNLADVGKARVEAVEATIEAELLHPLLRWGDVARYHAAPRNYLLLTQDPHSRRGLAADLLASRFPNARAYLERFRELLLRRAAYRRYQSAGPFWSMYDVGPYTVAPIKVVWRRMDRRIQAAVATGIDDPRLGRRAVVPQETCVLIATQTEDEAHYLCAVLNSEPVHRLVAAHSVRGGKGFGTPGMLDYVPIRRYDPACPTHGELAALSRAAHAASRTQAARAIPAARAASSAASLDAIQSEIDRHVAALWKDAPTRVESIRAAKPGPY